MERLHLPLLGSGQPHPANQADPNRGGAGLLYALPSQDPGHQGVSSAYEVVAARCALYVFEQTSHEHLRILRRPVSGKAVAPVPCACGFQGRPRRARRLSRAYSPPAWVATLPGPPAGRPSTQAGMFRAPGKHGIFDFGASREERTRRW